MKLPCGGCQPTCCGPRSGHGQCRARHAQWEGRSRGSGGGGTLLLFLVWMKGRERGEEEKRKKGKEKKKKKERAAKKRVPRSICTCGGPPTTSGKSKGSRNWADIIKSFNCTFSIVCDEGRKRVMVMAWRWYTLRSPCIWLAGQGKVIFSLEKHINFERPCVRWTGESFGIAGGGKMRKEVQTDPTFLPFSPNWTQGREQLWSSISHYHITIPIPSASTAGLCIICRIVEEKWEHHNQKKTSIPQLGGEKREGFLAFTFCCVLSMILWSGLAYANGIYPSIERRKDNKQWGKR